MRALVLAVVAAVLTAVPAHAADGEICQGKDATIVEEAGTVVGTDGDDVIVGGAGVSQVRAGDGDDTVCVAVGGARPDGAIEPAIQGGPGHDAIEVRGTDDPDTVLLREFEVADVHMGAGKDRVSLVWRHEPSNLSGSVDGGSGRDTIEALATDVVVGLPRGRLTLTPKAWLALVGFEHATASASVRARVIGNNGNNRLNISGCDIGVVAGGGKDIINVSPGHGGPSCPGVRAFGNGGNDTINGSRRDDLLVGGSGFDRVRGFGGGDRCVAEKTIDCGP